MISARYFGSRRGTLLGITVTAILCAWALGLDPRRLFNGGTLTLVLDFVGSAFVPAFDYEDPINGAEPFLLVAVKAVVGTIRYAILAMTVAVPCAVLLSFFASVAWWPDHDAWRGILRTIYFVARAVMAFARSIHELIWGLLFITAIGMSSEAAIIAIAIPYSGILAKIYSEILEEHSKEAQETLRAIGGRSVTAFLLGLVPAALPDLISYTFYRFECGIRSAAVLGFVGIETVGHFIKLSSDEFHYREVWTYLYVLIVAIVLIEWWASTIRKQLLPAA